MTIGVTKLRKALKIVRDSAGAVTTLRALASLGVHETKGGEAIAEGRVLIERGWLPQHRVCHACGALAPVTRPVAACAECDSCDWYEPSEAEHLHMALARADEQACQHLGMLAGSAAKRILSSTDVKAMGAQAKLIPYFLRIVGGPRWAGVEMPVVVAAAGVEGWASTLSQEEIERLPGAVLDRLREIADEHKKLEEEARALVQRALTSIEVEARDPRALEEET